MAKYLHTVSSITFPPITNGKKTLSEAAAIGPIFSTIVLISGVTKIQITANSQYHHGPANHGISSTPATPNILAAAEKNPLYKASFPYGLCCILSIEKTINKQHEAKDQHHIAY